MKDLGVKVVTGKALDAANGLTLKSIKDDGYECAFLGIGWHYFLMSELN